MRAVGGACGSSGAGDGDALNPGAGPARALGHSTRVWPGHFAPTAHLPVTSCARPFSRPVVHRGGRTRHPGMSAAVSLRVLGALGALALVAELLRLGGALALRL